MKVLIFDSGTLINLSMNGLLYLIEELKKDFDGKFIITQEVKYEIIDRPLGIHRFELGALMVKNMLDSGVLELPSALDVNDALIKKETKNLMDIANHSLQINGKWIPLVSEAETSCLALSSELSKRGVENLISIDERTTRVLCENPQNLEHLMSERLHQKVTLKAGNFSSFSIYKFIRSTEIVFVAYKKSLTKLKGKQALEALLYATKFKGCAVSFEEIEELKKL